MHAKILCMVALDYVVLCMHLNISSIARRYVHYHVRRNDGLRSHVQINASLCRKSMEVYRAIRLEISALCRAALVASKALCRQPDRVSKTLDKGTRPYLAIAVGPEVDDLADKVVERGVGALVHDDGGECQQRHQQEAELDALVYEGAGEGLDGQLERKHGKAEEGVDDLEDGYRLDGAVEVGSQEVPEDLGPEVALERGGDLVWTGQKRDQKRG
jgi:hypothetical protein